MNNVNETLMGAGRSNIKEVSNIKGKIEAGLIVRLKADGKPSLLKADGEALGLSMGNDLSATDFTAVARKGLDLPIKLASGFVPVIGAQVSVSDTTGEAMAYTGAGDTYVNAIYKSGKIVGLGEDGLNKDVALIDFIGGL